MRKTSISSLKMATSNGKMEKVRPLIYVQSDTSLHGYGIADFSRLRDPKPVEESLTPPYLILYVEPNESGRDVGAARAIYHDGNRRFTTTLNNEVQNVGLFLNSETLKEGNLADKVAQYLSFYSEADVSDMARDPLVDTSGAIMNPTVDNPLQMGLDAFVIGVAGYLASLKFLLEDDVYANLPFSFSLPFHTVNENVLNTNMFKYMSHPCTAVVTHSTYCSSRLLLDHILRFCNEWGPIFDDGPTMDFTPSILDTVSGYCKLTVTDMSDFQQNALMLRDEMSNLQSELRTGGEEMLENVKTNVKHMVSLLRDEMVKEFKDREQRMRIKMEDLFEEKLDDFRTEIQDIFLEEMKNASKITDSEKEKREKRHHRSKSPDREEEKRKRKKRHRHSKREHSKGIYRY